MLGAACWFWFLVNINTESPKGECTAIYFNGKWGRIQGEKCVFCLDLGWKNVIICGMGLKFQDDGIVPVRVFGLWHHVIGSFLLDNACLG